MANNGVVPTCEDCAEGGIWALTVFFPGAGEVNLSCEIEYTQNETDFITALGREIASETRNQGRCCCVRELMAVTHDPRRTTTQNGARIARLLNTLIRNKVANTDWLKRVKLHLVGFSAGGIVAVHTAERIRCGPFRKPNNLVWCDRLLSPVELDVDIVTMATPFNLGHGSGTSTALRILAGIGGFFLSFPFFPFSWTPLGCLTFFTTVPSFYAGGRPPRCFKRLNAFVSSKRHGDDSFGADQNPRDDSRLQQWLGSVTRLSTAFGGQTVSHTQVPQKVLELFSGSLNPGCRQT